MAKRREIRNSTAEFLIFQIEGKEQGVEVFYKDKTVWCTQKAMGMLFDCDRSVVTKHLRNIFDSEELNESEVCAKFAHTASDGKTYQTQFYNLDAVISVGYRVNSIRATQFRQWATSVLREYAIRGYVLDRKRMENGTFLDEDYFEQDIYATAIDYNRDAPTTKMFFKMMQNKMHYAVHGHTAAELIVERADAEQEHMGLTTWENAPDGKIVKTDVSIAKNYLKEMELADMGQLVNGMTMEDWAKQIDTILAAGGNEVLQSPGKVTAEEAKEHAETEFEKYRIIQDRLFQSDFDRFLGELPFIDETDTK